MTRVVAKSGQKDLVVTSAQPGVLYVSGLPVEKNFFAGLRRKLTTIAQAFETIHGGSGKVEVVHGSSCAVALPSGSIDYVFTDPPRSEEHTSELQSLMRTSYAVFCLTKK